MTETTAPSPTTSEPQSPWRRPWAWLAVVAGLLVAALLVWLIAKPVLGFLSPSDPEAYASTVADGTPVFMKPDVVLARIDDAVGEPTGLVHYAADDAPTAGQGTASLSTVRDELQSHAVIPPNPAIEVYTNVLDPDAVARVGAIYIVQFARVDEAREWLRSDPAIFTDAAWEKARDTYRSGAVMYYYAPVGSRDITRTFRQAVKELVWCDDSLAACDVPGTVKDFDDWAPRASARD